MMMPTSILFLPGTGLPEEFYSPLLALLGKFGGVRSWQYRHQESMVEACRRLGGSADLFETLRSEICFGPSPQQASKLGLTPSDGISSWYERHAGLEGETAESLWSRTIVVGHSQGAGHALMISQKRSLAGALMIAGPADSLHGRLAPWTQKGFQTPAKKRLLMVHAQDAGYQAVAAHAEASGLRRLDMNGKQPNEIGGLALVDTATVPALSAHGCLAGGQTWATTPARQAFFRQLLLTTFERWQSQDF